MIYCLKDNNQRAFFLYPPRDILLYRNRKRVVLLATSLWQFAIYFATWCDFTIAAGESRANAGICVRVYNLSGIRRGAVTRWTVNTDSNTQLGGTRYIPQAESGLFAGATPELLAPCDTRCSSCCTTALCRLSPPPPFSARNLSCSLFVCIPAWKLTGGKVGTGANERVNIFRRNIRLK